VSEKSRLPPLVTLPRTLSLFFPSLSLSLSLVVYEESTGGHPCYVHHVDEKPKQRKGKKEPFKGENGESTRCEREGELCSFFTFCALSLSLSLSNTHTLPPSFLLLFSVSLPLSVSLSLSSSTSLFYSLSHSLSLSSSTSLFYSLSPSPSPSPSPSLSLFRFRRFIFRTFFLRRLQPAISVAFFTSKTKETTRERDKFIYLHLFLKKLFQQKRQKLEKSRVYIL